MTIVFNGEEYIEQTIQSVINQSYDNIEYIIIDGGSTDTTLDIIKKYEEDIDYWISESDEGIYDAMNKGIVASSGEWLYFLNAGDVLYDDDMLMNFLQLLVQSSKKVIVTGKVDIVDSTYETLGFTHPSASSNVHLLIKQNCIAHQATFINRQVFNEIGFFSLKYKIMGDYDFWIRALKNKIDFYIVDIIVAKFLFGGVSSQRKNYLLARKEQLDILFCNGFISHFHSEIMYFYSSLLFLLKSIVIWVLGENIVSKIRNCVLSRSKREKDE